MAAKVTDIQVTSILDAEESQHDNLQHFRWLVMESECHSEIFFFLTFVPCKEPVSTSWPSHGIHSLCSLDVCLNCWQEARQLHGAAVDAVSPLYIISGWIHCFLFGCLNIHLIAMNLVSPQMLENMIRRQFATFFHAFLPPQVWSCLHKVNIIRRL